MTAVLRIIQFNLRDLMRNRWTIFYTLFFFLATEGLIRMSGDLSRAILSMIHLVLYIIPLFCVLFGSMYIYNSGEFVRLLLSQPVGRTSVLLGQYLGLSASLIIGFSVGMIVPLVFHPFPDSEEILTYLLLLGSGWLLTLIFIGLAFLVAIVVRDKGKGVALSLFVWLTSVVLYDGAVLLLSHIYSDYPIEKALIGAAILNPVDLARILVMMRLDFSALLGYTGAVFERFFGSRLGVVLAVSSLLCWAALPLLVGLSRFRKKDL